MKLISLQAIKHLGICRSENRSTFKYGFPDKSIDNKKESRLREAVEIYIEHKDLHNEIRFDIVSIVKNNFEEKVYHITDAF